jgi:hypothetical protein
MQGLHALAAAIHPEMFVATKGLRQIEENTFETRRKGVSGGLGIDK